MKKLVYLVMAFSVVYIGLLLTGCQKQSDESSTPPAAAPEMPSTNAPSTNAPAQ